MHPVQIMLITTMQVLASVRWVDEADEKGPIDMDIFFDRVVIIAVKTEDLTFIHPTLTRKGFYNRSDMALTTGVFITKKHVLMPLVPSYNFQYGDKKDTLIGMVLRSRTIVEPKQHTYDIINVTFDCNHIWIQKNIGVNDNQLHGVEKLHSPTHDLSILRIAEDLDFLEIVKPFSFKDYKKNVSRRAGPIVTRYAKKGDVLGGDVKFASLGFRSRQHMKKSNKLASRAYEEHERVLEDCEEWMPRYWGHFICIKNVDNYKGVGSGAILVHNNTVFGIGSFLMKKANESILVFTDIRPYSHTFLEACPVTTVQSSTPLDTDTTLRATRNKPDIDTIEDYY